MKDGALTDDRCWEALGAHDARFDGLFFVGVKSTGIYCRAVCPAKRPKRENCTFYKTAAQAEAAGFRPCLKCRPELAAGSPVSPDTDRAIARAEVLIREHADTCHIADIAYQLGLSERQLRRLFEQVYGVTPSAYRTTCRLLLAKSLLTDTDLSVTRVAFACGFSSVRRFNDAFSGSYRMPPSHFRQKTANREESTDGEPIILHIGYRPPYRFDLLLSFLGQRAIKGVEAVVGAAYMRTVRLESAGEDGPRIGWIKVENEPDRNRLALTVSSELFGDLPLVVARVRRLFDTDGVPGVVDEGLTRFYERVPEARLVGIRVPCCFDGFEMAVRAILGQQITVKAAGTLAGRVARTLGAPVSAPHEDITTTFPPPRVFCVDDAANRLGELGVIGQRARAICALAKAICEGEVTLRPGADLETEAHALRAISGIGDWTVQYLLMRAYAYPDAFPAADLGVLAGFPGMKPRDLAKLSQEWSPWRSYVVMSLWQKPPS